MGFGVMVGQGRQLPSFGGLQRGWMLPYNRAALGAGFGLTWEHPLLEPIPIPGMAVPGLRCIPVGSGTVQGHLCATGTGTSGSRHRPGELWDSRAADMRVKRALSVCPSLRPAAFLRLPNPSPIPEIPSVR